MKKSIISLTIALMIFPSIIPAEKMQGVTAIPSFYGPGFGYRVWSSPQFGWGLEVMPSWQFNDFTARGRLMYTISTGEKTRWFGLLSVGYMTVNEKESGFEYSVSMPTGVIGIGREKLYGFKQNKGLSWEAGYQFGKADYTMKMDLGGFGTMEIEGTYKVSPIYVGASFSYYFSK